MIADLVNFADTCYLETGCDGQSPATLYFRLCGGHELVLGVRAALAYGGGYGLSCFCREKPRQLARFGILDVKSHGGLEKKVGTKSLLKPTAKRAALGIDAQYSLRLKIRQVEK